MNPCWRCDGTGTTREPNNGFQPDTCPSCGGNGEPERLMVLTPELHDQLAPVTLVPVVVEA